MDNRNGQEIGREKKMSEFVKFNERVNDAKDDAMQAIDNLVELYAERIDRLEDKLEAVSDREDLWEVFLKDPKSLSKEEIEEMFNLYEKRALALSAFLQGEIRESMQ